MRSADAPEAASSRSLSSSVGSHAVLIGRTTAYAFPAGGRIACKSLFTLGDNIGSASHFSQTNRPLVPFISKTILEPQSGQSD